MTWSLGTPSWSAKQSVLEGEEGSVNERERRWSIKLGKGFGMQGSSIRDVEE